MKSAFPANDEIMTIAGLSQVFGCFNYFLNWGIYSNKKSWESMNFPQTTDVW